MVLSLVEPYDGLRRPMRVSGAPMSDRVNCIFPTHDVHTQVGNNLDDCRTFDMEEEHECND